MTILFSRNNAVFQPGANDFPVTTDPSITEIQVALEHEDWPEGPCFSVGITWGDGTSTGVATIGGGVVRDKAGNPTGGTMVTTWNCHKPLGVISGTVHLIVLQRISTAVLIEGF